MKTDKKVLKKSLRSVSLVANFGFTMAAAIFIGYYLGCYIDGKLGTSPWFMLIFLILFMAGAFIKFLQSVREVNNDKE